MLVENISREEFNQLLPSHLASESLMVEEAEGIANKAGNVIGTMAEGKGEADWNHAVLRRNKVGNFRICDVGHNLYNRLGIERSGL